MSHFSRRRRRFPMAVALLVLLGLPAVGDAAQPADHSDRGILQRGQATGDWYGLRRKLSEGGVDLSLRYIGEALGDVSGGSGRGWAYDGLLEMELDLDLHALLGWTGASLHATGYQIHGRSVTADHVGNLMTISNIEASPASRLSTLWLQQDLLDGRLALRAGRLAADTEFLLSPAASEFINSTFGWYTLGALDVPSGGPVYPLAAPGALVRVSATKKLSLLAAAFAGDPHPGDPSGTRFGLGGGVFAVGEAQLQIGWPDRPGVVKLGGWYHDGHFPDLRLDQSGGPLAAPASSGVPRQHRGNYGIYGLVDQTVWREPGTKDQGVRLFLRAGGAPADRNLVDFYVDGGLTWTGLIPGRPRDKLGLAAAYSGIGSAARDHDRDLRSLAGTNTPLRSYEALLELTYVANLTPWWSIQPDLQVVLNPGGGAPRSGASDRTIPDALVVGVRTTISF